MARHQYGMYADIVGGWVCGSEKVENQADIIYEWSLGKEGRRPN